VLLLLLWFKYSVVVIGEKVYEDDGRFQWRIVESIGTIELCLELSW